MPRDDSLAQVAGANARKLRRDANVTLDELAAAASSYGLPWTTGRVGALESGQVKPDLATLYGVGRSTESNDRPTSGNRRSVRGEGDVAINGRLTVPLSALRPHLPGGRFTWNRLAATQQPRRHSAGREH